MISITRADLNQAIAEATTRAHGDTKQLARIEKATVWLSKWGGESWTLKTDVITIHSSQFDTNGEVYRLTLGDGFMDHQCKSRRPCWHQILGSLIMAAAQLCEDREALEYGVWYFDMDCCGGQGCSLCMITVEPAYKPTRVALAPAVMMREASEECIPW